mgnify:CR=1 FL=1|tara:strand:- start:259 stop:933 length:675 start_codon:yes stop_codon:yes gene_type:complete
MQGFWSRQSFVLLYFYIVCVRLTSAATLSEVGAVELNATNLTENLDMWDTDMAVMFFAPWCKYCKQLKPSWDQIAKITSQDGSQLAVGTFDCESDSLNTAICQELAIDRYPSIFFFGFGDFNQAPRRNIFGKNENSRVVRYNADLYPERIFDWMRMLHGISKTKLKWGQIKTALTGGKSIYDENILSLKSSLLEKNQKLEIYADEIRRQKKVIDSYSDINSNSE